MTPYSALVGDRDPLDLMRESVGRIERLVAERAPEWLERPYAPGKWTARELIIHLAQTELALGFRARMGLCAQGHAASPFDADRWLALDRGLSAREAAAALAGLSRMNVALFASLTPADRATAIAHPKYGSISVEWVIQMIAGHQLHHLRHIESIA